MIAKKRIAEFGLPRIIILVAFVLLLVLAYVNNMDLPWFMGDVLRRWGMWGLLVLAMVPGIQSGIGPNFGITLGVVGGLVGAVLSMEMRYVGVFDFAAGNPSLFTLVSLAAALAIGTGIGVVMGILYGLLLNRVKGSEMAVSVYVGFSAVALFNILWALMPIRASFMIFPATGRGLRGMINLRDDWGGFLNQLWQFEIGRMVVPTGLLLLFFFACFGMWVFFKSRLGMMMSAAGANPEYARASGINVDKMRILGTTMSTALGAAGIVIYAQAFGFLQLYNAPLMMGFSAVASVLIGGATVKRAKIFDVLFGAFLFHGILTVALPVANEMLPEAGLPEMMRMIITNGIILYALSKAKGGR
jgi:simple sugar transport system permease protein